MGSMVNMQLEPSLLKEVTSPSQALIEIPAKPPLSPRILCSETVKRGVFPDYRGA